MFAHIPKMSVTEDSSRQGILERADSGFQGEDGFLITTPGPCLTDVRTHRILNALTLTMIEGANRRYMPKVQGGLGEASCGKNEERQRRGPREAAQASTKPASCDIAGDRHREA